MLLCKTLVKDDMIIDYFNNQGGLLFSLCRKSLDSVDKQKKKVILGHIYFSWMFGCFHAEHLPVVLLTVSA